jgi:hypothetical protein
VAPYSVARRTERATRNRETCPEPAQRETETPQSLRVEPTRDPVLFEQGQEEPSALETYGFGGKQRLSAQRVRGARLLSLYTQYPL